MLKEYGNILKSPISFLIFDRYARASSVDAEQLNSLIKLDSDTNQTEQPQKLALGLKF